MPKGKKKKASRLDPTLSRGIIAVLLTIFAIIIILSFFGKAGIVGIMLNDYILSFLFGSIRYFTPAIILILSWFLIRDVKYNYRPTHIIGSLLFFLSLSSVMHLGFATTDMWTEALSGHGGGIFGMLAWPMKQYLGTIAAYVILIGIVVISIFLIFNTTLTAFVIIHQKIFEGLGWIGKSFLFVIKKLFVPGSSKDEGVKIRGEYDDEEYDDDGEEYADEEEYEDEEEDTTRHGRRFLSKRIRKQEEGVEEDDDEEVEEEEEEKIIPKFKEKEDKKDDVWSKRVIIKNLPPLSLLTTKKGKPTSGDIKSNAEIIHSTLSEFNVGVAMGEVRVGPTVTQYSLKPDKGVKLTKITSLSNDLALALAAHPIRIEAPIPGQSLVGIEVPNQKSAVVSFKELLESKEFEKRPHNMMVALGKDVGGKTWFADLPKMPHMLIAGATGSGKTVCMNTIIMSLLYQNTAETLRMIMVDPKRVELTLYNGIPHLLTPVITNTQQTVNALKWCIGEMDRRFEVLSKVGNRDINSYNEAFKANKMPHIVFIIDELADLMATAASEIEAGIIRLAQMARAVGIHLLVATQRPSVDVITGLMKANIPGRIAFSVASLVDSRTILDTAGAEKLIGRGDMLFQTAEFGKPIRIQGAYISENELKNVVKYLKGDEEPEYDTSIVETAKSGSGTMNMFGGTADDQDPLFEEAKEMIIKHEKASASFLQRRLKIGYARAARILDELEEAGIVGPSQGAKPREILVTAETVGRTMNAGGEHNVFNEPEDEEEYEEDVDEEEEEQEYEDGEESEDEEYEDQYADVDMDAEEDSDEEEYEEDDSVEEEIDDDHTHNARSRFEY